MTVIAATPATLKASLDAAQPGDRVKLQGAFGAFRWGNKAYPDPVTWDLTDAVISGWYLGKIENVRIEGGTFTGKNPLRVDSSRKISMDGTAFEDGLGGVGAWFNRGSDISLTRCVVSDQLFGVRFDYIDDASLTESQFRRLQSDGARFAECHRWTFSRNALSDFRPVDGAHPDACQAWSRATSQPSCDITVTDNLIVGWTQGVFLGNHQRVYKAGTTLADGRVLTVDETLDDGGFDRVEIARNRIIGGYPQGICIGGGRDARVIGNHLSTYEGAEYRASINLNNCTGLVRTGNVVDAGGNPRKAAVIDPS
jgi:hypothetical protein